MYRLIVRYGDEARRLPLGDRTSATLGSAEGNDLVVPFPGVSRRHARIEPGGAGVRLVDLGSKNGLVVAGERREEVMLAPGQRVFLGRAELSLEVVDDADLELALVLDPEAGPAGGEGGAPAAGGAGETAPHWALELVRDLEQLSPGSDEARRTGVLERTARSVGAEALWTFAIVERDLFLRDCVAAGPPGSDVIGAALAAIERSGAGGGSASSAPLETAGPAGPLLVCSPPGEDGLLLLATFPSGKRPAEWVGLLLAHVAERLSLLEAAPGEDDVAALVAGYARQAAKRYGKRVRGVGRRALELLQRHPWRGRLAELENLVAGAVLRCPDGGVLESAHFRGLDDAGDAGAPSAAGDE